jgi:hypothetical protein
MKNTKTIAILFLLFACFVLAGCGAKKPTAVPAPAIKGISLSTVAEHNTPEDCWLVINNNIYNITDYIAGHPGGEKKITDNCGKEATA